MMDLFKVAIRNVGRNKRRTIITILTVFIGVAVSIATRSLLNGFQSEIRSNLTRKIHGDLQIHKVGYQDSLESNPYKLLFPERVPLDLEQAPRLKIMALLNHQKSQTTTPVMISGIDSVSEANVCPRLAASVLSGIMLDSAKEIKTSRAIDDDSQLEEAVGLDGSAVPSESPRAQGYHQMMVTPNLLRGLSAEIGDEVVVLIGDRDNMQQAIVANIVGVIDVAMPGAAPRMAWMDLRTLQETLHIDGEVSEIALRVSEGAVIDDVKHSIKLKIAPDQVVETWLELGGFLRDVMALQDIIFSAIVAIMFAIVIAAIINTSLMTVMERTREIGTLMALGYRRKHILFLFLTEAGAIGGAGGFLGLIVGGGIVSILNVRGLVVTLPGQSVSTHLYPYITLPFLSLVLALSIVAALVSGLVPAYRASRLKPVQALSST